MLWSEFNTAVRVLLTVDADRLGVQSFIDKKINLGVIDIQRYVPALRLGHETIYSTSDFSLDGNASLGRLPDEAVVREGTLFKYGKKVARVKATVGGTGYTTATLSFVGGNGAGASATATISGGAVTGGTLLTPGDDYTTPPAVVVEGDGTGALVVAILECCKSPLINHPWSERRSLTCGSEWSSPSLISIDPKTLKFLIYPIVDSSHQVSLIWDGLKMEFADDDSVPFPETMDDVVANYVKSELALHVNNDPTQYKLFGDAYRMGRTALHLDLKERASYGG